MEAGGRMWIPEAIEFHERQRCNAANQVVATLKAGGGLVASFES
jgi:hypothetical protein